MADNPNIHPDLPTPYINIHPDLPTPIISENTTTITPDQSQNGTTDSDSSSSDELVISPINPKLNKVPGKLFNGQPLTNTGLKKHKIKLKVKIYHNGDEYDITPYILQVKTHTGLGEASGRFTILLSFKKRWDALIFAMDYVEISFSRYLDEPPVMMRGFVGNVRRSRTVDSSGKVHRSITINGENFGKIWNNYKIEYLVQAIGQQLAGSDITGSYTSGLLANMLTENYGITSSTPLSGSIKNIEFVKSLIDKMLNPYIQVLQQVTPQIPTIGYAAKINSSYALVNGPLIQYDGTNNQTVYDVLNQFGNRPWCEYYIDDFSDGPIMFYRNTPLKDESGNLIDPDSNPQQGALGQYWGHPIIDDTDIIEEDVGTSDNEVYSYFFTFPAIAMYAQTDPRAVILGNQAPTLDQESSTSTIYNPHVDLENFYRFGFRPMMLASNSIPLETADISETAVQQAQDMNTWLTKSYVWSHKMKNGTMRIKGNEHVRVGRYLTQKSTQEEYYIESVDHEITMTQPGSLGNDQVYGFTTTVGVTRGRDASND